MGQPILFYLVGASGSGKDSVLRYFQQHVIHSCESPIVIAHRYISRPGDDNEQSVYLSEDDFLRRKRYGLFALDWQANGFYYGIGKEIDLWLEAGLSVLVNGSRAYMDTAKVRYHNQMYSIQMTVPDHVLEQRLAQRSRETSRAIRERMQRHRTLKKNLATDSEIVNESNIDTAAQQLYRIINDVIRD